MPKILRGIADTFISKAFAKKKEAENHAYFLACKFFYENGLLDEHLYSNIDIKFNLRP